MSSYEWINRYIGLPWEANGRDIETGFDCWGLIMHIYKERLGIDLPDWQIEPFNDRNVIAGITKHTAEGHAIEIDTPGDYDIAMVARRGQCFHVGLCLAGGVLHVHGGLTGSTFETIEQFKNYSGQVKFYRWGAA